MRKFLRLSLVALAFGLLTTAARTAPSVEADAAKEYPCTPDAGAWVICIHEFRGPDAPELARQMVQQIRQRDHLPAYVFNFGAAHRQQLEEEWSKVGNKVNPDGTPRKLKMHFEEECGVLIGGFRDLNAASAALKTVKQLPPPQLKLNGKTTCDTVTVLEPTGDGKTSQMKQVQINPFPNSFAAPNPTIQHDKRAENRVDPILKTLNETEDYSLLRNPKPWTLAVQEYSCGQVVQSSTTKATPFLDSMFSKKGGDAVTATALQAHELARVLRELKFDAYVLHTRRSSIVAIGGFTDANDPQMQQMAEKIQQLKIHPVELFVAPMEVPRP